MAEKTENGEFKHYNPTKDYYYSTEEVLDFVNSWAGKLTIPERWVIKNLSWGRDVLMSEGYRTSGTYDDHWRKEL